MSVDVRPPDATPSVPYERLDRLIEAHDAELIRLRHDLHRHPELSNRERRTASVVAEHLRALGLDDVRTGIAGHGVVGVLRGGMPGDRAVALRADMDALPLRETSGEPFASTVVDPDYPGGPHPVAHACGHDCHMAVVLAATDTAAVRDLLERMAEHTARAHGCCATVDFLQPVPPVDNAPRWIDATLPTLRRVVGAERVVEVQPTLVYDDVSELIDAFGGVYLQYGVQDTELVDGVPVARTGGRGFVPNHHPAFYANDSALADSVRIHVHVAVDHLEGLLEVGP